MKRTILWLLISLVTFALGVATAFVWFDYHKLSQKKSETIPSVVDKAEFVAELPILKFCELVNNSEVYDGKVVKIRMKLHFAYHGFFVVDENCNDKSEQTGVSFGGKLLFYQLSDEQQPSDYGYWSTPEITAIGRFSRTKPSEEDEVTSDEITAGKKYFLFEVLEVEKTSKK